MRIVPRLESLRKKEHAATVEIIEGLLELKKSAEHLELGYASIWDFLVGRLNYSNAAASRRYKAMKCAEKFPQVLTMLREHRTNLTALAKAEATLARAADPDELLAEIDGSSSLDVERAVARRNPVRASRERVTRRYVRPPESAAHDDDGLFADERSPADSAQAAPAGAEPAEAAPARAEPRDEDPIERVRLSLSLSPEDFEAFERARALISRKLPAGVSLEDALCELVAFYLKQKGPRPPKKKRAPKRQPTSKARSSKPRTTSTDRPSATRGRHVPRALRDEIWRRDGGRCTYVGRDGRRCPSTHDLQLDHIEPFAVGGKTSAENLRLLCGPHNRHRTRGLLPQRKSGGGGNRLGESVPVYGIGRPGPRAGKPASPAP